MISRREFLWGLAGSFGVMYLPAISAHAGPPWRTKDLSFRELFAQLEWIGWGHASGRPPSLLLLRTNWYVLKDPVRKPKLFQYMEAPFGLYGYGRSRSEAEELLVPMLKELAKKYVLLRDPPKFRPEFWRAEKHVVVQRGRVVSR